MDDAPSLTPIDGNQPDQAVPVVVLHGIYGTGLLFDGLRSVIDAGRYRVIAPDLQGHGRNRAVVGPLDPMAVADALTPTLDAAGFDRFHLVGHSHGGAVAQVIAQRLPDRVRSLVLVSTYAYQPLVWWERVGGLVSPLAVRLTNNRLLAGSVRLSRISGGGGRRLSREAAASLARQIADNDPRQMARALHATRAFDSRPWLDEIRAPTLVVAGSADLFVSRRQATLLAEGIPGARLETIRGAGHLAPLSHPDEFGRLVMAWLDGHGPDR